MTTQPKPKENIAKKFSWAEYEQVCGLKRPKAQDVPAWEEHIRLSKNHHLKPLLYWQLEEYCEVNSEVIEKSKAEAKLFPFVQLQKLGAAKVLHEELDKEGIPHYFLKGLFLSQLLYGDPFMRQSNDVDIIVPPKHVIRTRQLLIELGYSQEPFLTVKQLEYFVKKRWEISLENRTTGIGIDLHWSLGYGFMPHIQNELDQDLWSVQPDYVAINDISYPFLPLGKLYPYQIMNGATECWARHDILVDLQRLEGSFSLDSNNLSKAIKAFCPASIEIGKSYNKLRNDTGRILGVQKLRYFQKRLRLLQSLKFIYKSATLPRVKDLKELKQPFLVSLLKPFKLLKQYS